MKKFVYLCGMMLLSMNMMAQVDLNDPNWNKFVDGFSTRGRSWVNWTSSPDCKWRGYGGDGVTSKSTHQVYQYSNCRFNPSDGTMELVAEYDSQGDIPAHRYDLPGWMHGDYPPSDGLFFFSGEIDARKDSTAGQDKKFHYGYFEIRCKLPQHPGTFPAFWLHDCHHDTVNTSDNYYEEIDIFEHSRNLLHPLKHYPNYTPPPVSDSARVFTTGIYHNLTGEHPDHGTESFARNFPMVPPSSNDLSDWHTFGCEWMPDHVYWYFDGTLVNSYYDQNHIPRHSMTLKTDYAIDNYVLDTMHQPLWLGSDVMVIDYIRAYELQWDCDTDEIITCQSDLDGFEYGVKKSVSITSTVGELVIGSTDKVTFRVNDSFEITGPFQVESGAEFTVIKQVCPNNN